MPESRVASAVEWVPNPAPSGSVVHSRPPLPQAVLVEWFTPSGKRMGTSEVGPNGDVRIPSAARGVLLWRAVADEIFAMGGAAAAQPTGIDRLYLARRPERKKKLVNHAEIEALVARHGFTLIYPEDHSLVEQIRFVRHAHHIVAPEGSNGLLALFGRPGLRVCTLTSPILDQLVIGNAIFAAMGGRATLFTGPMATDSPTYTNEWLFSFWNDYRIDARALDAFLGDWLREA